MPAAAGPRIAASGNSRGFELSSTGQALTTGPAHGLLGSTRMERARPRSLGLGGLEAAMSDRFVTRGFVGRRGAEGSGEADVASRTPPGQYLTTDFPVLSAGPTPRTPLDRWSFSIEGLVREPVSWTWDEFLALPTREWTVDISCVTKWTKLDMRWRGVSVDTLFEHVDLDPERRVRDRAGRTAATRRTCRSGTSSTARRSSPSSTTAEPLAPGARRPGPPRRPGRYFWKSAKWVRGLRLQAQDEPGFWESLGYHNRGDQWLEERYSGD